MRRRALLCLVTAMAFFTYSVCGLTLSYAAPRSVVVEVKTGTLTGKLTDMDEKPLQGKTVKILDSMGKVKYSATTGQDGDYAFESLSAGTYTMVVADSQKVTLLVKESANNHVVNAMLPRTTKPYGAGAVAGLGAPLVVAIAGGCVLVGVAAYGIASYDSKTHDRISK